MVAGRASGATSTIVGVAAQAATFNPLVTAVMAVGLCGSLFAVRIVRRRMDDRRAVRAGVDPVDAIGSRHNAHFTALDTTNPTEPPARR